MVLQMGLYARLPRYRVTWDWVCRPCLHPEPDLRVSLKMLKDRSRWAVEPQSVRNLLGMFATVVDWKPGFSPNSALIGCSCPLPNVNCSTPWLEAKCLCWLVKEPAGALCPTLIPFPKKTSA